MPASRAGALRDKVGKWLLPAGAAVGTAWFVVFLSRALDQPIAHDAFGYRALAQLLSGARPSSAFPGDWLQEWLAVRLMGYPVFLVPYVGAIESEWWLRFAVAVTQAGLYLAAVLSFVHAFSRLIGRARARLVGFALLAVPYPYFLMVEVLADSLALTLAVACFAALAMQASAPRPMDALTWFAVAALCAGIAMVTRQDAWPLLVAVATMGAVTIRRWGSAPPRMRGRELVVRFSAVAASLLAVTGAVIVTRVLQFVSTRAISGAGLWDTARGFTFYSDIGVANLKYTTGIGPIDGPVPYPNPFLPVGQAPTTDWYWQDPLDTLGYFALRLFALFDWDWPFPYIDAKPDGSYLALFVLTQLVVINGVAALTVISRDALRQRANVSTAQMFRVATLGAALTFIAIRLVTQVELRYGLTGIMGLTVLTAWWLTRRRTSYRALIGLQVAACAVWMPIAWFASEWIQSLAQMPGTTG